jgi:hypothetical protein
VKHGERRAAALDDPAAREVGQVAEHVADSAGRSADRPADVARDVRAELHAGDRGHRVDRLLRVVDEALDRLRRGVDRALDRVEHAHEGVEGAGQGARHDAGEVGELGEQRPDGRAEQAEQVVDGVADDLEYPGIVRRGEEVGGEGRHGSDDRADDPGDRRQDRARAREGVAHRLRLIAGAHQVAGEV